MLTQEQTIVAMDVITKLICDACNNAQAIFNAYSEAYNKYSESDMKLLWLYDKDEQEMVVADSAAGKIEMRCYKHGGFGCSIDGGRFLIALCRDSYARHIQFLPSAHDFLRTYMGGVSVCDFVKSNCKNEKNRIIEVKRTIANVAALIDEYKNALPQLTAMMAKRIEKARKMDSDSDAAFLKEFNIETTKEEDKIPVYKIVEVN